MTRGECDDFVALIHEGLELGGEEDGTRSPRAPTLVERGDTDGVASGDDTRRGNRLVEEDEGEHAV